MKELQKKSDQKKIKRISLEDDFAQIWTLLNHRILTTGQAVRAVAIQITKKQQSSLLEIINQEGWISQQTADIFRQKVNKKNVVCKSTFCASLDDEILGQKLVANNVLSQQHFNRYMQGLVDLHQMGIKCTLSELLTSNEASTQRLLSPLKGEEIKVKTERTYRTIKKPKEEFLEAKNQKLKAEMSLLLSCFEEKILTKKEIAQILLLKSDSQETIVDIIQKRYFISSERIKQLSDQNDGYSKRESEIDNAGWQLASYIIRYEILPRQEMQKLLRITTELGNIGIQYSLDALLVDSGLITEESISHLIDECHRSKNQGVRFKNQKKLSLKKSSPKKINNRIIIVFIICLPLLLILEVWVIMKPTTKRNKVKTKTVKNVKHKVKVSDKKKKFTIKKVKKISLPQKKLEDIHSQKGLVSWGNFWISKQQFTFLEKKLESGEQFHNSDIYLQDFKASCSQNKKMLTVSGKIDISPFYFPEYLPVKLYIELYDGLRTRVYSQSTFLGNSSKEFYVKMATPIPLAANIYYINISFKPQLQETFSKYLLNINKQKNWNFFLHLGNRKQIKESHILFEKTFTQIFSQIKIQKEKLQESNSKETKLAFFTNIQNIENKISVLKTKITPHAHITRKLDALPHLMQRMFVLGKKNPKKVIETLLLLEIQLQKITVEYQQSVASVSSLYKQNLNRLIHCNY